MFQPSESQAGGSRNAGEADERQKEGTGGEKKASGFLRRSVLRLCKIHSSTPERLKVPGSKIRPPDATDGPEAAYFFNLSTPLHYILQLPFANLKFLSN